MHLVFDISLTVAKPWLAQPSGIDRVEFAHARHWRGLAARDVTFVMRSFWGPLAMIPDGLARDILADVDRIVAPGMSANRLRMRARPAWLMTRQFYLDGQIQLRRRLAARPDSVLLTASNATLHLHDRIRRMRALGCRFVPMIFDTIPLTHPQYFPEREPGFHARRMQAVAHLAEAGLVDSAAAHEDMRAYFGKTGLRLPPMTVAHPGLDLPQMPARTSPDPDAYMVMLGSLEPRKNHLLMLQIWQTLRHNPSGPRLLIIGRRPYEANTALVTLDRGAIPRVEYLGRLPDAETARILAGASALLFPSIAEGFGIPLAEALSLGVPVIASDIPVFHEVGGDVPEYLDPLDGPGWRQAVLDYATPASPRRDAQLARLPGWKRFTWEAHFAACERALRAVAAGPLACF